MPSIARKTDDPQEIPLNISFTGYFENLTKFLSSVCVPFKNFKWFAPSHIALSMYPLVEFFACVNVLLLAFDVPLSDNHTRNDDTC